MQHMLSNNTAIQSAQISCPKCGHAFNVEDVLAQQIQEKQQKELSRKIEEIERSYSAKVSALEEEKASVKKEKAALQEQIDLEAAKLAEEREKVIKKKFESEYAGQIQTMQEELQEKSRVATENSKMKLELERMQRDRELEEANLRAEIEAAMHKKFASLAEENLRKERESIELKLKEKDELVKTLTEQMAVLQKKAEQGSMERQGEMQELVIAEWLRTAFPRDVITDVKKGAKGADVIHSVRNNLGVEVGRIYYESKRTAAFSNAWIDKLKQDNTEQKADALVLITQALPEPDWRVKEVNGVWVASFDDFKVAAVMLRQGLIEVAKVANTRENSGSKMQLLYDFLTSNEFRGQMENMLGGFHELAEGYRKEKSQMEKLWKAREKQIDRILLGANQFIGSIQGIAGNAIPDLKLLGEESP